MKTVTLVVADRMALIRGLANRLDPAISSIKNLRAAECMRSMSETVRKILLHPEDRSPLAEITPHVVLHGLGGKSNQDEMLWRDFWDSMGWNSFSNLCALLVPNLEPFVEQDLIRRLGKDILALEDAKANPHLCHFNVRDDEPLKPPTDREELHAFVEIMASHEKRLIPMLCSLGAKVV